MSRSEVSPAELQGETLRRWYLRRPDEIERERQAAADARYRAFFGREDLAEAPSTFRPAGEPPQDALGASINRDTGLREEDLERASTWGSAGPNRRRRDERSSPGRGTRPVPLPSQLSAQRINGADSLPFPPSCFREGGRVRFRCPRSFRATRLPVSAPRRQHSRRDRCPAAPSSRPLHGGSADRCLQLRPRRRLPGPTRTSALPVLCAAVRFRASPLARLQRHAIHTAASYPQTPKRPTLIGRLWPRVTGASTVSRKLPSRERPRRA